MAEAHGAAAGVSNSECDSGAIPVRLEEMVCRNGGISEMKRNTVTITLCLLLNLAIGACQDGTPYTEENSSNGDIAEGLVRAGHVIPDKVYQDGASRSYVGVQSVLTASYLAGRAQLVTTGTVTQIGATYSYNHEPSDRLVVRLQEGRVLSFTIITIQGDYSTVENFFRNNYQLSLRAFQDQNVDFAIESMKMGDNQKTRIKGKALYDGLLYTVDLNLQGSESFEIDMTGSHYRNQYQLTGKIITNTFDLTANELWKYEMVTAGNDSASSAVRQIGSTLKLDNDIYQWVNVRLQKSFRDGKVSQKDTYWAAVGEIRRNGKRYGRYFKSEKAIAVTFNVEVAGRNLEIESWPLY